MLPITSKITLKLLYFYSLMSYLFLGFTSEMWFKCQDIALKSPNNISHISKNKHLNSILRRVKFEHLGIH